MIVNYSPIKPAAPSFKATYRSVRKLDPKKPLEKMHIGELQLLRIQLGSEMTEIQRRAVEQSGIWEKIEAVDNAIAAQMDKAAKMVLSKY